MSPRDSVLQQALALSPDDQMFVVQSLEEHLANSVPGEISEADGISEAAFLAELQRRSETYRRGETMARDWNVVWQELERRQAGELKP